jgi:hypothetical protein
VGASLVLTAMMAVTKRGHDGGKSNGILVVQPLRRAGGKAPRFYERHGFKPGPWTDAMQCHVDDDDPTGRAAPRRTSTQGSRHASTLDDGRRSSTHEAPREERERYHHRRR